MDLKWVIYCTIGELLGFAAAATFNIVHLQVIGEPSNYLHVIAILLLATAGGIAEGSILAWFQYQQLQSYVPRLDQSSWIRYTASIAAIGWFLGMLVPTLMDVDNSTPAPPLPPPLYVIALFGMGMGIVLGLLFGVFQAIPLGRYISNPGQWILGNTVAWSFAMAFLMLGPSLVPTGAAVSTIILIAMVSGLLAGLVIGLITMLFLDRLQPKPSV